MRKAGVAEWVLKRAAGAERGTAMYGDLVELAATRGGAWFWVAYARTLVSLGWRTPVALACGFAAFQVLASLSEYWILHTPGAWREHLVPLLVSAGPALTALTVTLWIGLPYLVVRYGVRDRLVQLVLVLFVLDTTAFLYVPWLSFVCAVLAVLLVVASLCTRRWRKAGAMAIAAGAAGAAAFACALGAIALVRQYVMEQIHPGRLIYHAPVPKMVWDAAVLASILAIACTCSLMHRWLASLSIAAGVTNA